MHDRLALVLGCSFLFASCSATIPSTLPLGIARADSLARRSALDQLFDKGAAPTPRTVGVLPFTTSGLSGELSVIGFGLADLLTNDLAVAKELIVLERVRTDAILRELALEEKHIDSTSRGRVGRVMGVSRMVVGDVGGDSTSLRIGTRITDIATSAVVPGAAIQTDLSRIIDAEKRLAFALLDSLGVAVTPAERAAIEQRRTENLAAFLAYSRGVREELLLGIRRARVHYRRALKIDPGFTPASENLTALADQVAYQPLREAGLISIQGLSPRSPTRLPDASEPAFRDRLLTEIIILVTIP